MVWRGWIGLAALALAACAADQAAEAQPSPASSASAARGLAYAQQVCAACHAVAATDGTSPNPNAPPFAVIANTPGMTSTALNAWLHSAHQSMPNLVVAPDDRADIYAYLESIRRGAGAG